MKEVLVAEQLYRNTAAVKGAAPEAGTARQTRNVFEPHHATLQEQNAAADKVQHLRQALHAKQEEVAETDAQIQHLDHDHKLAGLRANVEQKGHAAGAARAEAHVALDRALKLKG